MARVKAVLRRITTPYSAESKREVIYADDYLTANIVERKITVNGERIKLIPREFRLFALLVERAGSIMTHQELLVQVCGWEYSDYHYHASI